MFKPELTKIINVKSKEEADKIKADIEKIYAKKISIEITKKVYDNSHFLYSKKPEGYFFTCRLISEDKILSEMDIYIEKIGGKWRVVAVLV